MFSTFHFSLPTRRADFFTLKRKQLKALCAECYELLKTATVFIDKHNYVKLTRKANAQLFKKLEALAIFDFHYTNVNRSILGMHQIVMYLRSGIYIFRYKGHTCNHGELEVHHLDSNPLNNTYENLVYVTPQQNKLCAEAVRKPYHGDRNLKYANIKSWATYGGGKLDTATLIRKTLVATFTALGFTLEQIPAVAAILMELPYKVGTEIIRFWRSQIIHGFQPQVA